MCTQEFSKIRCPCRVFTANPLSALLLQVALSGRSKKTRKCTCYVRSPLLVHISQLPPVLQIVHPSL